jgi:2-deoxy-D-gluconate 3-dehydrogenase
VILDRFRLDGLVAMVTGATRGLGKGMAVALAEAGADIVALNRSDSPGTGEEVAALGHRYLGVNCDLRSTSVEQLRQIVERVAGQMGHLDILVNNAGTIRRAPALVFGEAEWDEVLQVNLKALFFLSQAGARVMARQGGGKIINVASMLSFQGGILVPAYAAAKSGVAGLTRALANEWAAYNVNVNAIAPGYMATANTAALQADPVRNQAILDRIPAKRWGLPDDLKGVVVFLASPASDYMHGAIIPVDGGWLAR